MDRLQKNKRSSKPYQGFSGKMPSFFDLKSAGTNTLLTDRGYGEGNGHMEKQMNELRISADSSFGNRFLAEENSYSMEFRRSSSSKGSGTPMKMLLAEEMSKEKESRRRSPSVIARLMGLDALPSQQAAHKQQKFSKSYFQRTRSVGFQEKYVTHEDHSFSRRSKEQQEFKDVFVVRETRKVEKHNIHSVEKAMLSSKLSEAKMAFIRQKFMDAKRLSTIENLHQSKEFHDAVEVLDSNKDLLLKFLQEPDSLFTKHLHDLQSVPYSPESSDITVLKSSKAAKHDKRKIYLKSERKMEGHLQVQKDVTVSFQKQEHGYLSHRKHDLYISHKSSTSQFEGNSETCHLPTRIVVLKPSHKKAHDSTRSISSLSSSGSSHSSHRKHTEFRRLRSQELFPELRNRSKLVNNVDFVRHMPKVSRETARLVTRQVRHSVSSDSNFSTSVLKGYSGDESSDGMSGKDYMKDSEALEQSSRHFYDRSSRCSPSSSYSFESSVSREAKRRLSERWRMTQKFQEVGHSSKGSSTLGEMLALPDRERPVDALDAKIVEVSSSDRSSVNEVLERWDCPLGISSGDGWKDGSLRDVPRSRSFPTSSIVYQSSKSRSRHGALGSDSCSMLKEMINIGPDKSFKEDSDQREASFSVKSGAFSKKSQIFLHTSAENDLTVREIRVNPDEQKSGLATAYLSEKIRMVPETFTGGVGDRRKLGDHTSVAECQDTNMIPKTHEELLFEPTACIAWLDDGGSTLCNCDHNDVMKETSLNQIQVESHGHLTEPESPRSSKDAEQPSPISVLEPPNEAELSSSECFESVSAGLHGLRMQLQLLKFDRTEEPTDGSDVIMSSDEDLGEGCDSLVEDKSVISGLFRHVEDREYLFLLDMLIDSGFYGFDHEMLFATSYSLEFPVAPCVFDNLEKKYGEQLAWPRWERRLLFDRINSVLAEILKPHMDLHPWVKPKGTKVGIVWGDEELSDKVLKLLDKHRKEGLGDTAEKVIGRNGWLELGDDIDVIGREIEKSLMDELMEEVVSGLSSCGEN